ncbi:MAG: copper homeostasis protein CutC [Algoriphagus sp.]|jgi:copper homeostasis protein|uniref:copper homeostasis protein CutC n=2 Tax=Algoriphagus sp. TaxID=1872435 RepID=UPI00277901CC|nr:copper homeostasis protein CutC [Algoriphagus sp.]MDP4747276.1 copper homeostasis protein CutC [Algoriphagus sp.]MDP4838498.1 copper homeostasis protein CutC [Algoriphagus sp.]MDP4904721.1 copper homeostasis protein CutC [Algoriphagus sp.]MDP4956396.1 copper homeostasis protein CutC [Algoriphagus sp.]
MSMLLEAPVFNLQASLEAAQLGIDRLELCANFPEGGETPSAGMLRFLKREIDIPIFVMIRPRGGNFVYSPKELLVMKQDIQLLGDLGADGFVFGALDAQGSVNESACESLLRAAESKPCTFHRAFDASADLTGSLEKIIQLGFHRVLTSGGENSIEEGLPQVMALLEQAKERIIILPGGGLKVTHVSRLKESGYLKEVHASCKLAKPTDNQFVKSDLNFVGTPLDFSMNFGIDPQLVHEFKAIF